MSTLSLAEQRAKIVADWRAMLDTAEAEGRALTAEEVEKSNKMEADIDALKKTIDARAKADAADRAIVPDSQRTVEQRPANQDKDAVRADFWRYVRGGQPSAELRTHALSPDSSGGFIVPDEFRRELITALEEENVIRGLATSFTTMTGVMTIPVNSAHGSASWKTEGAAYSASDETFAEVTLNAYKGTALIKVTEELLNDSAFPLESFIAKEFGRRLGKLEEEAFINGTGSGQPTGIVGGSTLGATASATNAMTADNLTDLYHSLGRAYRAKATWIMKDSTVQLIRKLKTGVSSDNTYLWQAGLKDGEPDRLFGRPVVVSEFMPAATSALKAVLFGDISYYYIGDRQAMSMQRLNELYAENGHIGFRQFRRTDGKLALATAVNHMVMA
jgi:HK97 family phage major capsid protein